MAGSRKMLSDAVKREYGKVKSGAVRIGEAYRSGREAKRKRLLKRASVSLRGAAGGMGDRGAGGGERRFDGSGGGVGNRGTSRQPRQRRK